MFRRCTEGVCEIFVVVITVTLSTSCSVGVTHGEKLVHSTFHIVSNSRLYSCGAECVSYAICNSFNFDKQNRKCYLNFGNSSSSVLQEDDSFIYSGRDSWEHVTLGPCHGSQCSLSEKCHVERNRNISCVDAVNISSLAQGKPTTASTSSLSVHTNAVDGRDTGNWWSGSCFHVAEDDYDPWWQVDLQTNCLVVEVRILSRSDCCTERLHDFAIEVYKDDPVIQPDAQLQLCYLYSGAVTQGGVFTSCTCTTPVIGRYLRIHGMNKLATRDRLQFCEVEVLGVIAVK